MKKTLFLQLRKKCVSNSAQLGWGCRWYRSDSGGTGSSTQLPAGRLVCFEAGDAGSVDLKV